jgi:DNA-binding LytR/AlgR family response regulator
MKINCIIIDDEPLARKGLEEYVQDTELLQLQGTFDNALKATDILMTGKIELLLLDIQMPKITGLEFLKTLANPPLTILTTAYPEYALQAFELNVLDYLLKPFSFERFLKAVMKAKSFLETVQQPSALTTIENAADAYFFLKTENKLVKIAYEEVLFVEALQNYVAVHTKGKKYLSYLTIKSVEEQLPAHRFIKIHKSYLVAADKVESIEGNEIKIGPHQIPISRNNKEEVLEKILQNRLLKR